MSFPLYPYQPFPEPVPAPIPQDTEPFCLVVDGKWIPYILGALSSLQAEQTWIDDQIRAIGEARNLIDIFARATACPVSVIAGAEGDDCMGCCLRWSEDGILQQLSCGEWVNVPGPGSVPGFGGNQPAQGTPQPPPGGCENFIGKVLFFGRWLLPVPVSTGDVISVTNAFGATTDYIVDYPAYRCGDGTEFFAGGCISGSAIFNGSDPAPAFHHGNLIAFDGVNYYDLGDAANSLTATINIPPGITDANLTFLINAPGPAGAGDITFDVRVCKAAAVPITLTGFGAGSGTPASLSRPSMSVGDVVYVTINLNPGSGLYDGGFSASSNGHWQIVSVSGFTVATGCPWEWNGGSCESGAPVAGTNSPGSFSGLNGNSSTQPVIGLKLVSVP